MASTASCPLPAVNVSYHTIRSDQKVTHFLTRHLLFYTMFSTMTCQTVFRIAILPRPNLTTLTRIVSYRGITESWI